ncbi:AGAP003420-PA-like protein [Anopheles sinensis]|uniref:AGAP003420-PA-like protein n=1 Tax=Anopheles sinensis TaxID=74873 RepID=A0A084VZE0_ANOSI|nr:AGAP003420-PA-like protein [Anopheles sinensis]
MNFYRNTRSSVSFLALMLVFLLAIVPMSHGEMRKSWQAKSADVQTQLLKAARLDEPPSAKPPETAAPIVEEEERTIPQPSVAEESSTTEAQTPKTSEVPGVKSAQFSSRVRTKYGGVVKPVKPIEADVTPTPEVRDRAEPLWSLEPNPDEIQVDDATVQDDDDDEEEEDDDDEDNDLLGWSAQAGKHGKEFDLIENILEEVEERVKQEKRPKEEPQSALPSEKMDTMEQTVKRIKEYTFPPVLNMTIDEPNNIVRVKLNQDVVRDMLTTGRDGGGGIGGKKMLRYILPLFILPFLIQSAVIPFMLTAVKLFLLKSLMAGKVAIFLLLLGAFKNFTKKESRDVYVKDVPDRRYEPSSEGFAYLAEGRPSNWVN